MRKKTKRILIIAGAVVLGIIVAAVLVCVLAPEAIVKFAIEKAATHALGMETRVAKVTLDVGEGHIRIEGMTVANPVDFSGEPHFVTIDRIDVTAEPGSLRSDTVKIDHVDVDGITICIEQWLHKGNIVELAVNLRGGGREDKKEKDGKRFVIGRVRVRDVKTDVYLHFPFPNPQAPPTLTVTVPEIRMDNLTRENAGGLAMDEVMRKVAPAVLAAVAAKMKTVDVSASLPAVSKKQVAVLAAFISEFVSGMVGGTLLPDPDADGSQAEPR